MQRIVYPGAKIFVQESDNKTGIKYDLISVYKDHRLVNIDSQIPNKVFHEWLLEGFTRKYFYKNLKAHMETPFDFYIETSDNRRIFVEVKGVTLEKNGIAMFPDAPTERGVKQIVELCRCMDDGYEAYVVFIVQMKDVLYLTPNNVTHKAFGDALKAANNKGLNIIALDTWVTENSISAGDYVDVRL